MKKISEILAKKKRVRAGCPWNLGSIPRRGRRFFSSTGSEAHPHTITVK
jgi:hypothetical protein